MDCHQADAADQRRGVARVKDRRLLNGIFLGVAVRGALAGPAGQFWSLHHLLHRFVRWRRAGVWGKIMNALARAHNGLYK